MTTLSTRIALFVSIGGILIVNGCEQARPPAGPSTTATTPANPDSKDGKPADGHGHSHGGHGAGPHDGTLSDWGGGKYHVEFTVDHGKKEATVYILGGDEKTPAPIKAKDGELLLTINEPSFQVTLKAAPQKDDPEGAASAFTGTDDKLGVVQEFAGTISGEVEGTPYAGDFKEEPHGEHDHQHDVKGDHKHDDKDAHDKAHEDTIKKTDEK